MGDYGEEVRASRNEPKSSYKTTLGRTVSIDVESETNYSLKSFRDSPWNQCDNM